MRKIITFLSIFVTVAFIALPHHAFSAENTQSAFSAENTLTNVGLAELIIATVGMVPPAGTEDLSQAEYYEVLSNMLASVGINNFVGTNPQDPVDCSRFVDIVYSMAGGTATLDTEGKIGYLVETGFMAYCSPNSVITLAFATEVFHNPGFAALVAEAYSPAGGEGAVRTAAGGAPGVKAEGVASTI